MRISLPLSTKRLLLRDFRPTDAKDIQRYASDPEVVKYMAWGPNAPEETRKHLEEKLAEQKTVPRNNFNLAVVLKSKRVVAGSIGLVIDEVKHRSAWFGYVLARQYWGRGLATEALRAILEFGFGQLNLHRIHATCDIRNKASARVMEKAGLRREGVRRKDRWVKGRWRDTAVYAILETEWKSRSRRRAS